MYMLARSMSISGDQDRTVHGHRLAIETAPVLPRSSSARMSSPVMVQLRWALKTHGSVRSSARMLSAGDGAAALCVRLSQEGISGRHR